MMPATYKKWAEVPEAYRQALKWSGGLVAHGQKDFCRVSCATWEYQNGVLHLTGMVADTSQRVNGVCLEQQITYLEDSYYGGNLWFHFHPVTDSEPEG